MFSFQSHAAPGQDKTQSLSEKPQPSADKVTDDVPQTPEDDAPARLENNQHILTMLEAIKVQILDYISRNETVLVINCIHEFNLKLLDFEKSLNASDNKSEGLTDEKKRLTLDSILTKILFNEKEQNKVVHDHFVPSSIFVISLIWAYEYNHPQSFKAILDDKLCELTDSDVVMLIQLKFKNYKKEYLTILKAHAKFESKKSNQLGFNVALFFKMFIRCDLQSLTEYSNSKFIKNDKAFVAILNEALKVAILLADLPLLKWCVQKTKSVLEAHNNANKSANNSNQARFNYFSLLDILIENKHLDDLKIKEIHDFVVEIESNNNLSSTKSFVPGFSFEEYINLMFKALKSGKTELFLTFFEPFLAKCQLDEKIKLTLQPFFGKLVVHALIENQVEVLKKLLDSDSISDHELFLSSFIDYLSMDEHDLSSSHAVNFFIHHPKILKHLNVSKKSDPLVRSISYIQNTNIGNLQSFLKVNGCFKGSDRLNKMGKNVNEQGIKILLHLSVLLVRDDAMSALLSFVDDSKNMPELKSPSKFTRMLSQLAFNSHTPQKMSKICAGLFNRDINPVSKNQLYQVLLLKYVSLGRFDMVDLLLNGETKVDGKTINVTLAPVMTMALHLAISSGYVQVTELLLQKGANPILDEKNPKCRVVSNVEMTPDMRLMTAFATFIRLRKGSAASLFKLVLEKIDKSALSLQFIKTYAYLSIIEKDLPLYQTIESLLKNTQFDYVSKSREEMILLSIRSFNLEHFKYIFTSSFSLNERNESMAELIETCAKESRLAILQYLVKEANRSDPSIVLALHSAFESACVNGDVEMAQYLASEFKIEYKQVVNVVLPKVMLLGHIGIMELILDLKEDQVALHAEANEKSDDYDTGFEFKPESEPEPKVSTDFKTVTSRVRANVFMFALQNNLSVALRVILQKKVDYLDEIMSIFPTVLSHVVKARYLKSIDLIVRDVRFNNFYSKDYLLGIAVQYNVIPFVEQLVNEANKQFDYLSPRVMSLTADNLSYANPSYDNNICFKVALKKGFYDIACLLLSNPKVLLTLDFDKQLDDIQLMLKRKIPPQTIPSCASQKKTLEDVFVFLQELNKEVARVKQSNCFAESECLESESDSIECKEVSGPRYVP